MEYNLVQAIQNCLQEIIGKNSQLENLSHLSSTQFRIFAVQRYKAAESFEALLEKGIELSNTSTLRSLHLVLKRNLRDEQGVDSNGQVDLSRAHSTWRQDFYGRLDITDQLLTQSTAIEGTLQYQQALKGLIASDNIYLIAEALLALEASIPAEFKRIQKARDCIFPELFLDQPTDSITIKSQKQKARLYLDDHIIHDAKEHYPELLIALESSSKSAEDIIQIITGIRKVCEAKKKFYSNE